MPEEHRRRRTHVIRSQGRKQVHFDEPQGEGTEHPSSPAASSHARSSSSSSSMPRTVGFSPNSVQGLLCGMIMAIVILGALVGKIAKFSRSPDEVSPAVKAYIDRAVSRATRDPVGRRDFALYADGGRVVSHLTKIASARGMTSPPPGGSADAAITDDIHVGNCWLFPGSSAQLGLKLSEMIHPTHVSIDHIPVEIAADIGQAPRTMVLWGSVDGSLNESYLREATRSLAISSPKLRGRTSPKVTGPDHTYIPLAHFDYDVRAPSNVQTFPMEEYVLDSDLYSGVYVLEILDNWGGQSTCLYRVRIHGQRRVH